MKRIALLPLVITAILLTGCSRNLTRDGAKEILDRNAAQSKLTQLVLTKEQMAGLMNKHLVTHQGASNELKSVAPCVPDASDVRIATGRFVFCGVVPVPPVVTWQNPGLLLTLSKPFTWRVVEVTGITDGQNATDKHVEYTWDYVFSDFTQDFQDAMKETPRAGKSLLRLYDDGWRFVNHE